MAVESLDCALEALRRGNEAIGALRKARPDGWRKNYVALRREAQNSIQRISNAGEACFNAGLGCSLESEFRHSLNVMRSRIALHQANWPVVVVDLDDPSYCEAAREVMAAIHSFEDVARRLVSSLRKAA